MLQRLRRFSLCAGMAVDRYVTEPYDERSHGRILAMTDDKLEVLKNANGLLQGQGKSGALPVVDKSIIYFLDKELTEATRSIRASTITLPLYMIL